MFATSIVRSSMAPYLGWVDVYTSTGGGGVNFSKIGWPTPSQNWTTTVKSGTASACGGFPRNTPFNMTAFEPKGYPFVRWETSGHIEIGNSTSNPTNATLTYCPDTDSGQTFAKIIAAFNGPAVSLPQDLTLLLTLTTATVLVASSRNRKHGEAVEMDRPHDV
jgi:hypothetical protein